MMSAIAHRGPTSRAVHRRPRGTGHTRLSIVDLAGGTQPIHNETGRFWIVYNGEVYNHPELRKDLERRGHRFTTSVTRR